MDNENQYLNKIKFDVTKGALINSSGFTVHLSYTEKKILELFLTRNSVLVTKDEIRDFAWSGRVVADTSISKSISNLRLAIKTSGIKDEVITTVTRVGYQYSGAFIEISDIIQDTPTPTMLESEDLSDGEIDNPLDELVTKKTLPAGVRNSIVFLHKSKIVPSRRFYLVSSLIISLLLFSMSVSNIYSYVKIDSKRFIQSEYISSDTNGVILIYKRGKQLPTFIDKITHHMSTNSILFYDDDLLHFYIGLYNNGTTGINFRFNRTKYSNEQIEAKVILVIRNEK